MKRRGPPRRFFAGSGFEPPPGANLSPPPRLTPETTMNTATNLLVILVFLSGVYTVLGLLCGILEKAGEMLERTRQRRRLRRTTRRRTPRRELTAVSSGARTHRPARKVFGMGGWDAGAGCKFDVFGYFYRQEAGGPGCRLEGVAPVRRRFRGPATRGCGRAPPRPARTPGSWRACTSVSPGP